MSDAPAPTSPNDYELRVAGGDAFDVREFAIDDGLSALFSVELVVLSPNPAVDFESHVGQEASFAIKTDAVTAASGVAPRWSGVISEIHQLHAEPTGLSSYLVTISPRLWILTQRTNCRVFQQKTDLDVAKEILAEWDIPLEIECARSYKTRKYRVQYQESDYAFLCRLLEASGITYLFRTSGGVTKLVLRDTPERGEERAQPIDHQNAPMAGTSFATSFRATRIVRPGRVVFADHDPRMPNRPLTGHATTGDHPLESRLEHFVYKPGGFKYGVDGPKDTPAADDRGRHRTDAGEAKRIAEESAASRLARSQRFAFDSNLVDLMPGLRVSIAGHAMAERYGSLLVTRVRWSGSSETPPRVSVSAVSGSAPYRPELVTPTPVIHGIESAIVVGPAGETIHTDEFGRVRVQFHWDRYGNMDETSSCWVPVNQPWAGGSMGAINIPRVGQEVMVGFLAGNPEEPMIVGRMYTNLLRPPFALPQNKTQNGFKSASVPETGGYNELMFEDKAGHELIRQRAEKDMQTRVNNDQSSSIGRHRKDTIEGNDKETVHGDQRHSVFQNMISAIGKNQITSVLGNLVSSTGAERLFQTVGNFVSDALSHRITSKTGTTISVGASTIHIGPDSIVINTPKLFLNPGAEAAKQAELGGTVTAPASDGSP
ncbi:MAG: type VI secretion system tip protein TssI/VgrG [Polyangiaceae bacterium]